MEVNHHELTKAVTKELNLEQIALDLIKENHVVTHVTVETSLQAKSYEVEMFLPDGTEITIKKEGYHA